MSLIKKSIKVGIANNGETNMSVDALSIWSPEKISYIAGLVFFKVDGTFYSMNKQDFKDIFES